MHLHSKHQNRRSLPFLWPRAYSVHVHEENKIVSTLCAVEVFTLQVLLSGQLNFFNGHWTIDKGQWTLDTGIFKINDKYLTN